jgi:diguanylate cyclase (GGDEF)-like protein
MVAMVRPSRYAVSSRLPLAVVRAARNLTKIRIAGMPSQPTQPEERATVGEKRARLRRQALVDLLAIAAVGIAIFFLCCAYDAWDQFSASAETASVWHALQLQELMILAILSPLAAGFFAYRRLRELDALLTELESHLGSLRAAQETIAVNKSTLQHQAYCDRLTGLPNHNALAERLETLIAQPHNNSAVTAIVYIGVDNFKRVNDHFGLPTGDKLLQAVAERLAVVLRDVNTFIARPGGDKFVVILSALKQPADAEAVTARVLESLNKPFDLGATRVNSGASAGITIVEAGQLDATELLHDAEKAMYEAKGMGRGRLVVFDPDIRERLRRRARLARDLPLAVAREELSLAFQPIVSLSTGAMNGVEGLLRWKHGELGPIGPGEFIPLAEESDLILEIGAWVLEHGCRQLANWIARFPSSAPQMMSLNVSRKQFSQPDLSEQIGRVIREYALPPDRIQVEITEDAYLGDAQEALRIMREIKAQGVKLAIDDFGAGSSTLAAVQQFPIDTLKVDRSLVTDTASSADSAAILHSLAVLVRNLNVKLVAEGIEDVEQVIALQELGCQYGQGYLFGRPMTPEAIEETFFVGSSLGLTTSGASAFGNSWEHRLAAFQRLELEEAAQTPDGPR